MDSPSEIKTNAYLLDLQSNRKIPVLGPVCKIGRADENDICMSKDASVSRFHGVITHEDGRYMIDDNQSRNGTFINGTRVTGPMPIADGDTLRLGDAMFWFVIESD